MRTEAAATEGDVSLLEPMQRSELCYGRTEWTRTYSLIREHIVVTWLNGDSRGFDDDTDLQETGILDSFSTLALVAFIDEQFGVALDPAEINAETFKSVHTIADLIGGKLSAKGMETASR